MEREPDNPYPKDDGRLLGWLKEARTEGNRINQSDPGYDKMDRAMDYILGNQAPAPGRTPSYHQDILVNRTRKAVLSHVSALTDVNPLFRYKTSNPNWTGAIDVLNKLITSWWTQCFCDVALADVAKYALACGSGDMVVEWDPHYHGAGLGDIRLIARDPRDTLPFRPSRDGLDRWAGLTIQESITPNALWGVYPNHAERLQPRESWLRNVFTKVRRIGGVVSPVADLTLSPRSSVQGRMPEITLHRTFLRDNSTNMTMDPILVGEPGRGQSYVVKPGERLYPMGRLIVWVEDGILYDGPNPYQHGMYPVQRLTLQAWPWSFFGMGLVHDLMPMQDAINTATQNFFSVFSQWVNRSVLADKNSVPDPMLRRFDPRKPLNKVKFNAAFGEGFKLLDGPTLPPWSLEFLVWLVAQFDDLAGFANLQALAQLRQMPSADTIEAYSEALTPELRLEGRQQEKFLRATGGMVVSNFMQFYDRPRRLTLLGDQGVLLEDFDFDPETMIPAMRPGEPNYVKELDHNVPRHVRARFFRQHISFQAAEASLLAMSALKEKMMYLQFSRMGYMDFWSVMEKFEVPNVGQPPAIMVPDTQAPAQTDPTTGAPMPPPLVPKIPMTITERLQAQMMMGIGMTESPAGRKASGQEAPHVETREGGRTTIAES